MYARAGPVGAGSSTSDTRSVGRPGILSVHAGLGSWATRGRPRFLARAPLRARACLRMLSVPDWVEKPGAEPGPSSLRS